MNKYNIATAFSKGTILPDSKYTQINLRASYSSNAAVIGTLKQGEYADTTGYAYSSQNLTTADLSNTAKLKSKDVWIEVKTTNGGRICYAHISVCTPYINQLAGNARITASNIYLTNMMLLQDAEIHKNLVMATKKLIEIKKANLITNAKYLSNWNEIQSIYKNWQNRQNFVKSSIQKGEVKSVKSIEDKVLMQLINSVNASNLNAIPVVAIVIVVLVAALTVTSTLLVQNALKPKYSESSVDLKRSKLLNDALDTLTPEEKQTVINDLEKQIDDAYNSGYSDGDSDTFLGTIKTFGLVALGVFGAYKTYDYFENKKSKKPNTQKK
ncbi:MAG: hypothetical protein PHQ62_04250 [Clostridia bacterium]|nr:hypothetical protein [Clostridia bacterium]